MPAIWRKNYRIRKKSRICPVGKKRIGETGPTPCNPTDHPIRATSCSDASWSRSLHALSPSSGIPLYGIGRSSVPNVHEKRCSVSVLFVSCLVTVYYVVSLQFVSMQSNCRPVWQWLGKWWWCNLTANRYTFVTAIMIMINKACFALLFSSPSFFFFFLRIWMSSLKDSIAFFSQFFLLLLCRELTVDVVNLNLL